MRNKITAAKMRLTQTVKIRAFALLSILLIGTSFLSLARVFAAGDVGYRDSYYSGVSAPTGQKPQSKLWFNDGIWWGSLFNRSSGKFEIHRFNWATDTWSTTGTVIDARKKSSADALWDGNKLYIVSAVVPSTSGDKNIYVTRYSYNPSTQQYAVDTGFPVAVTSADPETVVMDKDTTGKLWVTFTYSNSSSTRSVRVTHTTTNDQTWIAPFVIPLTGASNLTTDDISTIVSFNGNIGVMWSNQNNNTVYFAIHPDGTADSNWQMNPALQGPKYADDHINIKSLQADSAGQVFAAVKTSLNDVYPNSNQPLILLLTLDNTGSWSRRTFGTAQDNHTRPIVLLDEQNREVYIFATLQYGTQTSGAIYYKQVSLDNASMQFPSGPGTPFMEFATSTHINNSSSTKQPLNGTTNLLVIAGDDTSKYYFHNKIDLAAAGPIPTATATSLPTATNTPLPTPTDTPALLPTPTDTPIPLPTPTNTPVSLPTTTDTPILIPTPTDTPFPLATPTDTPVPLPTPTDTSVPLPTPTDTPTPTPTPSRQVLFDDGFESGDFSAWSLVKTGADGTAVVQSTYTNTGVFAAQLSETALSGSYAYVRKYLQSAETVLTVSGDFIITQEGVSGANVPIFRLFDSAGTRLVALYRQNLSHDQLWITHGGTRDQTTGLLPLNTWSKFELHVVTGGASASTVQVYQDGNLIFQTFSSSLGTSGIFIVQIGNDTAKQIFTMDADNVQITN